MPRNYNKLVEMALAGDTDSSTEQQLRAIAGNVLSRLEEDLRQSKAKSLPFIKEVVEAKFAEQHPHIKVEVQWKDSPSRIPTAIKLKSVQIGDVGYECTLRAYIRPEDPDTLVIYIRRGKMTRKSARSRTNRR
jgi:hypothetical protein